MITEEIQTQFNENLREYLVNGVNQEEKDYDPDKILRLILKKHNAILAGKCVYDIASAKFDSIHSLVVYVNMENAFKFITSLVSYGVCDDILLDSEQEDSINDSLVSLTIENNVPLIMNKMFYITHTYDLNGTMFSFYNKIHGCLSLTQKYLAFTRIVVYLVENGVNLTNIVENMEVSIYRVYYDGDNLKGFGEVFGDEVEVQFLNTEDWVSSKDWSNLQEKLNIEELNLQNIEGIQEELTISECEEFAIRLLYAKIICFGRFLYGYYSRYLERICNHPLENFTLEGLLENLDTVFLLFEEQTIDENSLVHFICEQTLNGLNESTNTFNSAFYLPRFPYSERQKNIDNKKYLTEGILEQIEKIREKVSKDRDVAKLNVTEYVAKCLVGTRTKFTRELVSEINYIKMNNLCGAVTVNHRIASDSSENNIFFV